MKKTGHPLAELTGVPEPLVQKLRQELSVTTIEEFLDLASRNAEQLQNFLNMDDNEWLRVVEQSRESLSPTELADLFRPHPADYPFRTGHDAPTESQTMRGDILEDDDD